MKGFEEVTLSWKGESYTVAATDQLRLIAVIEDAMRGPNGEPAVMVLTQDGGPGYARLATAYGQALRHAGARVSDEEVFLSMMEGLSEGDEMSAVMVQNAVLGLLAIIAPPVHRTIVGIVDPEKKPQPPQTKKAS